MYVVPTFHPAALLRDQTMMLATISDLRKAVRVAAEGPTLIPACERSGGLGHMPEWATFPTAQNVREWLHNYEGETLACDLEATFMGQIMCLGLWPVDDYLTDQGLCIPFLNQGGGPYWTPVEGMEVKSLVHKFLGDAEWPKVWQNGVGFDIPLLREAWGLEVRGTIGDTMVAHHLVMPELPHGLAFLSSIFTDMGPYKIEVHATTAEAKDDLLKFEDVLRYPERPLREYCLKDCFATAAAWVALAEMMEPAAA